MENIKYTATVVEKSREYSKLTPVYEVICYTTELEEKEIGSGGNPIYGDKIVGYESSTAVEPEYNVVTYEQIPIIQDCTQCYFLKNTKTDKIYPPTKDILSIGNYNPEYYYVKYGFSYTQDGKEYKSNDYLDIESRNIAFLEAKGYDFSKLDCSYMFSEKGNNKDGFQKVKK